LAIQVSIVAGAALTLQWLLGRWCSTAAARAIVGALGLLTALTLAAFVPWQGWWGGRGHSLEKSPRPAESASVDERDLFGDRESGTDTTEIPLSKLSALLRQVAAPSEPPRTGYVWKVLAGVYLAGATLSFLHLSLGLIQVSSLRRRSAPVRDRDLLQLAAALAEEIGAGQVEVRETSWPGLPATVGWRRPLILLPLDWRSWSESERRAVLAHELAHIRRRDFLVGLLASVVAALHFYHPLIRRLMTRLRLRQELAADALAARFAGGRRSYLRALARLALRPPGRVADVPPRLVLSAHGGALFRRVQMLRITEEARPLSRSARRLAYGFLVVAALAASGVRLPGQAPGHLEKPQASNVEPFDLTYFSPDDTKNVHAVIGFRPGMLLTQPDMETFRKEFGALDEKMFGEEGRKLLKEIAAEDFEQLVADLQFTSNGSGEPGTRGLTMGMSCVTIRMRKDMDWDKLLHAVFPKLTEKQQGGVKLYGLKADFIGPLTMWCHTPDQRTLVATGFGGSEPPVLTPRDKARPRELGPSWKEVERSMIAVAIDNRDAYWVKVARDVKELPPVAKLFEQAQWLCLGVRFHDGLHGEIIVDGQDAAAAEKCRKSLDEIWSVMRKAIAARSKSDELDEQDKVWLRLGEELLNSGKMAREGATVHAAGAAKLQTADFMPKVSARAEQK
jgi:beta-lactamase regulating signal transducer with metallopeptidase domain